MRHLRIAAELPSVLIGVFYSWVTTHFWSAHALDGPLMTWLQNTEPPRQHIHLVTVLSYSSDAIINVLLAVPFASMFVLVARLNNWPCVAAAVAAATITTYWGTVWESLPDMVKLWGFWFGVSMSVLALPAAFAIVRATPRRWLHE